MNPPLSALSPTKRPPQPPFPAADFTIALVGDDEGVRTGACSFLEQSGFQAWGIESAQDFYVGLLRHKADLVVVDLGLPGDNAIDLTRRLAAQRVPVIAITAQDDPASRINALDAGALQYFVKPTDLGELAAGIRSILRHAPPPGRREAVQERSWRLDAASVCLIAPNQGAVPLTGRELTLLDCLVAASGEMVGKPALLRAMHYEADHFHRIEAQLTRLRRKTLEATGLALPVRSIFGRGLSFMP
ncbi:MAG: response regulator transcription factor [Comamonas sp.]